MWTVLKSLLSFFTILLLCFLSFLGRWGMWDLNFLTRDWTRTRWVGRQSLNHWIVKEDPPDAFLTPPLWTLGFPGGSDSKESTCNAGDWGSMPGSGRSPREENGYPLQNSCLENSMDREAWKTTSMELQRVAHNSATNTFPSLISRYPGPCPSICWPCPHVLEVFKVKAVSEVLRFIRICILVEVSSANSKGKR